MVASIGNNGPGGSSPDALFAAGAPGVGNEVIGVASFDNAQLLVRGRGTPYGYNAGDRLAVRADQRHAASWRRPARRPLSTTPARALAGRQPQPERRR